MAEAELLYKIKVDAAQAISQMEMAASKIQVIQREAANSATGFAGMQNNIKNASYQIQDFIVQVTGGQDAVRAFGQQAPQLLGGFGAAGAAIGVIASLVPAAITAIKSFNAEAISMADATKAADSALGDLKKTLDFETKKSLDPTIQQFKDGDKATREWIIATERLNISMVKLAAVDLNHTLVDSLKEGVKQLGFFQSTWKDVMTGFVNAGVGGTSAVLVEPQKYMTDAEKLAEAMSVSVKAVENVETVMRKFKDQKASIAEVTTAINEVTDSAKKPSKELDNWVNLLRTTSAEVEKINRSVGLRTEKVGDLLNGNTRTTSDDKKAASDAEAKRKKEAADLEAYKKTMDGLVSTEKNLTDQKNTLNQTGKESLLIFERQTEASKQLNLLNTQYADGVTKLTAAQYEDQKAQLLRNDALEKSNFLQQEANKYIDKTLTAKENYVVAQERINFLMNEGVLTQEQYTKAMAGAAEQYTKSEASLNQITTAIGSAFSDAILNGKSFTDVMSGLARTIAEVAIKALVLAPLLRNLQSFAGNLWGGIGGGASGGAIETGSMIGVNSPGFANGAAFTNGMVTPFASGTVINHPTFFPMANGRGLMGEAGPEAVMPLKRGPDGKLGVTSGGSGGGTQVNIYNQSGSQVETKERQDPNGMKVIEVMIKKVVGEGIGRGEFDKTFGSTFGLRRQGAR